MNMLLGALWLAQLVRAVLRQGALWQVKEYRPDRLRAHLRLASSRVLVLYPAVLGRALLLAAALLLPQRRGAVMLALTALYAATGAQFLLEMGERRVRRPVPTSKALGIMCTALLLLVGAFVALVRFGVHASVAFQALDLALPFVVGGLVLAAAPITAGRRAATVRRAAAHVRSIKHLITVGVTGSYGKSSTKEFLATLLDDRFRVLKTPANVNTEIGIAQHVLAHARPEHEVFVCEMGAYREGEIARAAAMVRPRIGILTAVGNQHLALFGSRDALARAKGELLAALPADGVGIVNGDDDACVRLARESPARRVLRFGLQSSHDVWASDVRQTPDALTLELHIGAAQAETHLSLVGPLHVPNFLAAAAAAHALGMTVDEIARAAQDIRPLPRTMEPYHAPDGTFIVDDSYSANPDGVIAALETLRKIPAERRIVVLTPLIELGQEAAAEHRRIGEALARVQPALAVLTDRDFAPELLEGASRLDPRARRWLVVEPRVHAAAERVRALRGREACLLLEGRIPETLRRNLYSS